jgi:hypothetical protein
MKSGDGATGVSSALGAAEGPFVGGAGKRVAAVVAVPLDEATDPMDADGVTVRRPAAAADLPTVVHAPPPAWAGEFT